jgi:hypothetical protein
VARHGELLLVGQPLLGLDHQREPHVDSCIGRGSSMLTE